MRLASNGARGLRCAELTFFAGKDILCRYHGTFCLPKKRTFRIFLILQAFKIIRDLKNPCRFTREMCFGTDANGRPCGMIQFLRL